MGNIKGRFSAEDVINKGLYGLVLGGSTTESALVDEGKRWPDLLAIPSLNFGKSRLNSSHTLINLHVLLNKYKLKPDYIFIMDGINNLSNYFQRLLFN